MNFIHVLILSIIEGITEFLPISSTGHLVLTSKLLGIAATDFTKTFEIAIQLGAILAVVALYYKKFLKGLEIYKKLFVAFLPAAIVGFTLFPLIKNVLLGSSTITLWALFFGGIALIIIEKFLTRFPIPDSSPREPTYRQALVIGTFQSFSIIPGVSRAAATIVGGLLTGLSRESATEFSFLLAIPTMFAATVLDIYKSKDVLISSDFTMLLIGMALSFIFATIAIKFLVNYVKKHNFTAFGVYRIALAILFWFFVK